MTTLKECENGFKYLEIQNTQAEAKIALQGAHVFHYQAKDKSALLWLSEKAFFETNKAIRGGVPICFPWFGKNKHDATLPQHGFARTAQWSVVIQEELDEGTTHIQLQLTQNKESLKVWAYNFDVRLDVLVSSTLIIELIITNTDTKSFEISTALHTYINISNIKNIHIEGLENRRYYDSLAQKELVQEGSVVIREEVDRVYFETSKNIFLYDKNRIIKIQQEGSNSMVVWNPWSEKSSQMTDMTPNSYETMVCLETANALEDARVIQPNETHILKVIVS